MAKSAFLLLMWFGGISGVGATVLSDLAATMQAGTWAELKTDSLGSAMYYPLENCASTIFGYSEDAAWDPNSEQFYFLGAMG